MKFENKRKDDLCNENDVLWWCFFSESEHFTDDFMKRILNKGIKANKTKQNNSRTNKTSTHDLNFLSFKKRKK